MSIMDAMPFAKEGLREILLATMLFGGLSVGAWLLYWPLAIPFGLLWLGVLSFFRDPKRQGDFTTGDLCSPADGRVTEISELDQYDAISGPAIRIGIFLSLFDVHINRSPCTGRVRWLAYREGEYLDARHPESGIRNESNTLLIDPDAPIPGPVVVRQIAGLVARRIVCHATGGEHMAIGYRFGLIKFGSRTELIIPRREGTEFAVSVGEKVRAGVTVLVKQPFEQRHIDSPPEDRAEPRPATASRETSALANEQAGARKRCPS